MNCSYAVYKMGSKKNLCKFLQRKKFFHCKNLHKSQITVESIHFH